MNNPRLAAMLALLVGLSCPPASLAEPPTEGACAWSDPLAAAARTLDQLPDVPTPADVEAMPAALRADLMAASLQVDPEAEAPGSSPRSAACAALLQETLRRRPKLTPFLAQLGRQFFSGDPDEAAARMNLTYDGNASRAGQASAPAVVVPSAAREGAPRLAPARPAWADGVFLPKTVAIPLKGDALGVSVHRLPNGLTVYLSPNRQEPRVSFEIAVRSGSRHDPLEATGMAHYLEHMQFKGTQKLGTMDYAREKVHLDRIETLYDELFATQDADQRRRIYADIDAESQAAAKYAVPNEFDKIYASAGLSDINAYTGPDMTSYTGSFPSNKADTWARVEADRLSEPVYRIFLPELETVYEEYNRGQDNPSAAMSKASFAALFSGHPYGRGTIGFAEHLKNPSISRMRRFFDEHYRPNNMAIVLSGDFDRAAMLLLIEKNFGTLSPAKIPTPPAGRALGPNGVERVEIRYPAEEAVRIGWLLPPHNHPDEDALTLAGQVWSNLINLRVNKAQKAKGAGAFQMLLNESGGWFAVAVTKEGQTLEQAERVLMDEVDRFKAGDFSEDDLRTAATQLEIDMKRRLQVNGERVGLILETYINGQDWQDAVGVLERLKRQTKADVLRVANRYLGENRVVVYRRKGTPDVEKVAKPSFTPVPIDTSKQSPFFKELAAAPSTPLTPHFLTSGRDYRTADLPWGRLYWTKNPVTDLFNLEFKFDRGTAHEKKLGLALKMLDVAGAGDLSVEEFQRTLDRLGSTMGAGCGERECMVQLTGLEKNLEETLRLVLLRFKKPNIKPGAFKTMVETERGDRADRKLDPKQVHRALGEFASRGRNSEVLRALTPTQLDALTESQLKDVLGSVFDYRRSALYSGSRAAPEVGRILTASQPRGRFQPTPKSAAAKLLHPARPRVLFVHQEGMKQALIGAYAADARPDAKPRLDDAIYNKVMGGGMDGVYFQEVRESRALAYSAGGGYAAPKRAGDEGKLWSSAGTQADKAVQTALLMRDLMTQPPVTPERYKLALRGLEESYRTQVPLLDEIPRAVLGWEERGVKEDPKIALFQGLSSHRPKDLAGFIRRFRRKPVTFYILGDRNSVDLDGLKQLGDFEENTVDDLFPF